ncbi:MAG: ABC transporter ATP-binding protein [Acidimicrobiales bacterium]
MTSLEVHGLTKRFGDVVAVDDLSLRVAEGAVTGFLGPNGAGKTTTLRMLLGLVTPTAGTATVGGKPYSHLENPIRQVGAVLESSGYYPTRRARDHLRILATAAGLSPARVDAVLEQVALTGDAGRRVGGFSLGMRQRLGLAAALLGEPEILILDEPANGLDPEGVHWLRAFLRSFAADGGTVLVSSHILAEVAQSVDDIVIIARGRLVTHSPLTDLSGRATPGVRVRTPHAEALRVAVGAKGLTAEMTEPDTVVVLDATAETVGLIAAGARVVVYEMATERLDLEGVFLRLTAATGTALEGARG